MTLWSIASTNQGNPQQPQSQPQQPTMLMQTSVSPSAQNSSTIPTTNSNFFFAPSPPGAKTDSIFHVPFPTFPVPASNSMNMSGGSFPTPSSSQSHSPAGDQGASSHNPKPFTYGFSPASPHTVEGPSTTTTLRFSPSPQNMQQQSQGAFPVKSPVEGSNSVAPNPNNGNLSNAVGSTWNGSASSAPSAPSSGGSGGVEVQGGWNNNAIPMMVQPSTPQQQHQPHYSSPSSQSSSYSFEENMRQSQQWEKEHPSRGQTQRNNNASTGWMQHPEQHQQQQQTGWIQHPEQQQQQQQFSSSSWNQHPERMQSPWSHPEQQQSGFTLPSNTLVFHGSSTPSFQASLHQSLSAQSSSSSTTTTKPQQKFPSTAWLWHNDNVTFVPYDIETSELLEKCFQQQMKFVEIKVRNQMYIVDFGEMCQIDKDTKSKRRLIIRADMSSWTGAQSRAEPSKMAAAGSWLAGVVSNLMGKVTNFTAGGKASAPSARWVWFGDKGKYEDYDADVSDKIEDGFQAYLSSGKKRPVATIQINGRPYKINYEENTQLSSQGKVRKIKRKTN